jgi:hypothetical protein
MAVMVLDSKSKEADHRVPIPDSDRFFKIKQTLMIADPLRAKSY